MKVVGLTGGIASGKSTVSNFIMQYNIPIIDSDKIAREVTRPGNRGLTQIREEFGRDVLNVDGTLNRKKLGNIVFNDNFKLQKLNGIIHPIIRETVIREIDTYRDLNLRICVLDAPILIEANFTDIVDYIILIYVDVKNQVSRLVNRDKISEGEAQRRINIQLPFDAKKEFANYIIDNSKDLENTKDQLNKILNEILALEDTDV